MRGRGPHNKRGLMTQNNTLKEILYIIRHCTRFCPTKRELIYSSHFIILVELFVWIIMKLSAKFFRIGKE